MFCPYCGTPNDAGARNCGRCGAAMPEPNPKKNWLALAPGQGIGCMLGLAALGIMALAVVLPQYKLAQLQAAAAKEAVVRSNMRSLHVALSQYATEFEQYPATLEPADANDRSLEYLAMTVRRLRDPFDPLAPAVIVSPADPPDWKQVKPGQVIYVPLQVENGRARSYIIYGIGKSWPINDVMRGGYGQ
ncbi:MAG TPA: zinc ribbon domain-containing protein [Candidatus Edwardsbacteria bacterium]|nr:zinc ribbon domain-containing protein [Candidatus Edwardsbacteria bacterium]